MKNNAFFKDCKVINVNVGDYVFCDICDGDFTYSKETGGFMFESKAVCPNCAPKFLASIKKYNEGKYIKGICPEDMSFGDFVRSYREIY